MPDVIERPDPQTPTRVSWTCPGCGQIHNVVEPRSEALETAWNLLALGVAAVVIEDNAAAVIRDQDLAERAAAIFAQPPAFIVKVGKRPWWDVRRYRKG